MHQGIQVLTSEMYLEALQIIQIQAHHQIRLREVRKVPGKALVPVLTLKVAAVEMHL